MIGVPTANTLLGRLLRFPLRLVPDGRPLRILTGPLAGKRWISTSATHGCWLGTYESELQRLFVSSLRPGDVFFDVGANVGFFTLLGSALVGPHGRVVAFEPLPGNVALLRENLELNGVANTTVIPAAVAETPGTGMLSESSSSSQGSLGNEGVTVPLVALDALLAEGTIPSPSVMKVDVEGAESRVLAGARTLLSKSRPLIFLSTHGIRQHQACWSYLAGIGYELRLRRDGSADGQYESVATHRASVDGQPFRGRPHRANRVVK